MTIRELLTRYTERLQIGQTITDTPYLDALVLLEFASGIPREQLLARTMERVPTLPADTLERFDTFVEQRARGMPIAYIRGYREFFGLDFIVTPDVLIPRPDTETLVEAVLAVLKSRSAARILDCCTGSGCVGIAVAYTAEAKGGKIDLTLSDVSTAALQIASRNAQAILGRSATIVRSDLLATISISNQEGSRQQNEQSLYDLICANPPYLTTEETDRVLSQGWGEPRMALDGGGSGMDLIGRLIEQAPSYLRASGDLLIEISDSQYDEVRTLLVHAGFRKIVAIKDIAGKRRVAWGVWNADGDDD